MLPQWVNLFPEIKEHLVNIFERYTHVLDAELQQRACEYLALSRRGDNDDLVSSICDEMPVFPERESALLSRLHSKGELSQDKRTWVIGHSTENKGREAERLKGFKRGGDDVSPSRMPDSGPSRRPIEPVEPARERIVDTIGADTTMGVTSDGPAEDIMSSLADLDLSGDHVQEEPLLGNGSAPHAVSNVYVPNGVGPPGTHVNGDGKLVATLGGVDPALLAPLTVAPNIEKVRPCPPCYVFETFAY